MLEKGEIIIINFLFLLIWKFPYIFRIALQNFCLNMDSTQDNKEGTSIIKNFVKIFHS